MPSATLGLHLIDAAAQDCALPAGGHAEQQAPSLEFEMRERTGPIAEAGPLTSAAKTQARRNAAHHE